MTAKFDKFKTALIALCKEHNVSIYADWVDGTINVEDGNELGELADYTTVQIIEQAQTPPTPPLRQIA